MTPRSPGRGRSVTLLLLVFAAIATFVPAAVLGHAELDTIIPADVATVDVAPIEIVGTFTEALDPSKSSFVVVDAAGATVASGGEVAEGTPTEMRLALPEMAPGTYEIRWTSGSAEDGDIARGTTTFTLTPPPPTPTPTPTLAPSATPAPTPTPTPSPVATPSATPAPSADDVPASASATDVLIPIIVAILVVAGLAFWLIRRRSGASGTP